MYLRQVPELPKRIGFLVPEGEEVPLGVPKSWWAVRSQYEREHLDTIPKDVIVIDPTPLFCDDERCRAGSSKMAYYFDENHLATGGSELVANEIFRQLEGVPRSNSPVTLD